MAFVLFSTKLCCKSTVLITMDVEGPDAEYAMFVAV